MTRSMVRAFACALLVVFSPAWAQQSPIPADAHAGLPGFPHFPPRAKRVIYLHMLGAFSQNDTLDYKPTLEKMHGEELPDSVRGRRRVASRNTVVNWASFPVSVFSTCAASERYASTYCGSSSSTSAWSGVLDVLRRASVLHRSGMSKDAIAGCSAFRLMKE